MKLRKIEEATDDLQTLQDYLRWGVSCFYEAKLHYGHGTDNAWDEVSHLILHTLHLPLDFDHDVLQARLTESEKSAVVNLIARRVDERIPAAYLTKETWFAGLPFYIDERALIPRSPIAELIENHFEPWIASNKVTRVLDLCTGSGCMAIACAEHMPGIIVDAVDISKDAIAVAEINVKKYELEETVRLINADLYAGIVGERYEVIISNPPYVDEVTMETLPAEYQHEPILGLAGGDDGLDVVVRILQQAKDYLLPGGILIVEVGANGQKVLEDRFPQVPWTWIDFERGGDGVFILTQEQLITYRDMFVPPAE